MSSFLDKNEKLERYWNLENRADSRWSWPTLTESWVTPGTNEGTQSVLGRADYEDDDIEMNQQIMNLGLKAMRDAVKRDTDESSGDFYTELADGCPEDPDAPKVNLRIRVPKKRREGEKTPVLFYIFGAGFYYYAELFDRVTIDFANKLGCVVVAPTYRTTPQAKFPDNINDLHAAYQWILDHGDKYQLDTDNIVIYGESGGGWYGIGLCHRLKRYGITPRGMVANCPALFDYYGTSMALTFDGGCLGAVDMCLPTMEALVGYAQVGSAALSPEALPVHATVEDVKGLPPMYLHAAESDPCRDGAVRYAQRLLDAGVFCGLKVWPGTNHMTHSGLAVAFNEDEYVQMYLKEELFNIDSFFRYDFRRPWHV